MTTETSPASSAVGAQSLFAPTMGLVAATSGMFCGGAYLARNMTNLAGMIAAYIGAFIVLLTLMFVANPDKKVDWKKVADGKDGHSNLFPTVLLMLFGALLGVADAPLLAHYARTDPAILWQAGGATALFVAALGTFGYTTRRDLSWVARASFIGLLALILGGFVLVFLHIPHAMLGWSILALVIFAGYVAVDFQRLRLAKDIREAPMLAAAIFLDLLNVFLNILRVLSVLEGDD